mgnify:CR=1 FL=1
MPPPWPISDPGPSPFYGYAEDQAHPYPTTGLRAEGALRYGRGGGVKPGPIATVVQRDKYTDAPRTVYTRGVRLQIPRAGGGFHFYDDTGAGTLLPTSGPSPTTATIAYVDAFATGSIVLTGNPADGETVILTNAQNGDEVRTFEFDNNASVSGTNIAVTIGATAADSATNFAAAVNAVTNVGVAAVWTIDLVDNPTDAEKLDIRDTRGNPVTFEFESGGGVGLGNTAVTIGATAADTRDSLVTAINASVLLVVAAPGGGATLTVTMDDTGRGSSITENSGDITVVESTVGMNPLRISAVPVSVTVNLTQLDFGTYGNTTVGGTGGSITRNNFTGGLTAGDYLIIIPGATAAPEQFDLTRQVLANYVWDSYGAAALPNFLFEVLPLGVLPAYSSRPRDGTVGLRTIANFVIIERLRNDGSSGQPPFINPNPIIVFVTADTTKTITAQVNAGPTDAGDVFSWWEVEMTSGNTTEVLVMGYKENGFGVNRNHTDVFAIPIGVNLQNKRIRFVVQAILDPRQVFKSLFARMEGVNFDNAPTRTNTIIIRDNTLNSGRQNELITGTPGPVRKPTVRRQTPQRLLVNGRAESRYKLTQVYNTERGRSYELLPSLVDFERLEAGYVRYRITPGDIGQLDGLAVRFYGDGSEWAWFAIASANGIIDPESELVPGMEIAIPPLSRIQQFLARASRAYVVP